MKESSIVSQRKKATGNKKIIIVIPKPQRKLTK